MAKLTNPIPIQGRDRARVRETAAAMNRNVLKLVSLKTRRSA
jgi:hypothetical protein